MDNSAETNPNQEPKVPKDWKVPWIERPHTKIIQLDIHHKFISVESEESPQEADYFFDDKGGWQSYRWVDKLRSPSGTLDQTIVAFKGSIEYLFSGYDTSTGPNSYIQVSFAKPRTNTHENPMSNGLATVDFKEGKLMWVRFRDLFLMDDRGDRIISPDMFVSLKEGQNGEALENWSFKQEDMYDWKGLMYAPMDKPNEFGLKDKNGQLVYDVEWKVVDGELVVSQTHLPEGIIKTVRAPLQIDMEKINQAVLAKPPYPTRKMYIAEALDVPWRNIDRIVGAGLSYSEQSKAKNI